MELRQLRYFVTVAEELHFGRAAQRLHIVQPAVSQQVARLERELGLTLLDRTARKVQLTREGERLLEEARQVLAAADRVKSVAAQLVTQRTRSIRIGASPGMTEVLHRSLGRLRDIAPDITVELDARPAHEQITAVRSGDLDFALVRGAAPALADRAGSDEAAGSGVRMVDLWREPVHVAIPISHPAAAQPALRLDQLADLPLRLPSPACDPLLGTLVVNACRTAGFEPRLGRAVSTVTHALLEIGLGEDAWTVLYDDVMPGDITRKVAIRSVDPPLTAPVSLVVSATQQASCVDGLREIFLAARANACHPAATSV
ncbi:MAG TPA: LysR family transcriptional regulator [Actinopolymorphaceae bacterium]